MLRVALAGLLVGAVPGAALPAQQSAPTSETLSFRQPDRRDGLPHHTAFALLQDHQGFLWVGTNDGMARYDGQTFLVLRHDPADSMSLANNTVRGLVEDSAGRLWVRTESGLDRYDRVTGQFVHYPISVLMMQLGPAGALLVAATDTLFRYDAGADRFDVWATFPPGGNTEVAPADDPIWGLLSSANGEAWLSTRGGRLLHVSVAGTVDQHPTGWRDLTLLRQDPRGRLWVGHAGGVGVFDPGSRQVVPHAPFAGMTSPVITAGETPDGVVWLGGSLLHRTDREGTSVVSVDLGRDPLASPIWSVLQDREGLVWLGTPRGLRFHDPYSKQWGHLAAQPDDGNEVRGEMVMALAIGPDGALRTGTLDGGLVHVDGFGPGRFQGQSRPPGNPVCGERIWAVLTTRRAQTWLGTEQGLCLVDQGPQVRVPLAELGGDSRGSVVFVLGEDRSGRVWVGGTAGLFRVDPPSRATTRVPGVGDGRDGEVNVEGLLMAEDGTIWAGTSRSDLYQVDPTTLATTRFPLGDSPGLRGSEGFWTLAETGDGRLWLGSDRGLFLFDPASGGLRHLREESGMPAMPVNAIVPGPDGALWLSTNNGLLRHANPLTATAITARVRHYTAADGLPFVEFNRRAAIRGPDGALLFGGMGGVVRFDPARFQDNPHPPPVLVTVVERLRSDGSVQRVPLAGDAIALESSDAGLVVEFTAPTLSNSHQAQFRYRMTGIDPDWVAAGPDRRVRYPALPPGRYTFQVRAANADGAWNLTGATLAILVPPPWWGTWWSRGLLVLLVGGLLVVLVRWQVTRPLRRQVRALELDRHVRVERERISRDLHDHVGAQVATLMAGIELTEMNASRGQLDPVRKHLVALREDAQRTMTQLRETVWSLQQERISVRVLVGQIQEHLRDRQRFLESTVLRGTGTGDLTRTMPSDRALHLFRVVQEAVSNAIHHAGATLVVVELSVDPEHLRLRVTDDGRFRPPPADHHGSGLVGMQARAAEIGGTFEVMAGNEGTTVLVTVPWRRLPTPGNPER